MQSQQPLIPEQRDGTVVDVTVRTGTGTGRTLLSAFDAALMQAGVANLNLIRLSSVVPQHATIRRDDTPLEGRHGERLFCVYSEAYADHPGESVWAGLGWTLDAEGRGLFVEHHGGSSDTVTEQIELSLADMSETRGGGYGAPEMVLSSVHCDGLPVCALAVAAFQVVAW